MHAPARIAFKSAPWLLPQARPSHWYTRKTAFPVMVCSRNMGSGSAHPAVTDETIFPSLGLNEKLFSEVGGKHRGRQHVNPLKRDLMTPPPAPVWSSVFEDPSLPLVVDIGSGYGRFCLAMAQVEAASTDRRNYLGIEIRDAAVERANEWSKALGLSGNVHFIVANGTVALDCLLESCPGPVRLVTIQYPDPQFKKRHRKRRIVQPALVGAVALRLAKGGKVLLQSDVLEVAEDMRDLFAANPCFELAREHRECENTFDGAEIDTNVDDEEFATGRKSSRFWPGGWLNRNPLAVPTEREVLTLKRGDPVYRVFLEKERELMAHHNIS